MCGTRGWIIVYRISQYCVHVVFIEKWSCEKAKPNPSQAISQMIFHACTSLSSCERSSSRRRRRRRIECDGIQWNSIHCLARVSDLTGEKKSKLTHFSARLLRVSGEFESVSRCHHKFSLDLQIEKLMWQTWIIIHPQTHLSYTPMNMHTHTHAPFVQIIREIDWTHRFVVAAL